MYCYKTYFITNIKELFIQNTYLLYSVQFPGYNVSSFCYQFYRYVQGWPLCNYSEQAGKPADHSLSDTSGNV